MEQDMVLHRIRDTLEKAGVRTSGSSSFFKWMRSEGKNEDDEREWDGKRLYVHDIPAPKVVPFDIAEICLSVNDRGIYFTFTLYFYTVLKDAMEVEDFRRVYDNHEIEWFPKLRGHYLDVSSRFSLEWDVEYDESIEDTLCRTFASEEADEIVEAVKTIRSIT